MVPRKKDSTASPDWAIHEAEDELYDTDDRTAIEDRAKDLATERDDERHNEYDDPDRGGEG